jgi:MYXO-CTERM domain-containing protein
MRPGTSELTLRWAAAIGLALLPGLGCQHASSRGRSPDPAAVGAPRAAYVAAVQANAPREYALAGRRATNPAHGFATEFGPVGPRLEAANGAWGLELRLVGYGCPGAVAEVGPALPGVAGNRVEYRREGGAAGDLVEWYVNGPLGLEQGFTLTEPPACAGVGGAVALELELGGDLAPALAAAGDEIDLRHARGERVLRYGELFVTDAGGRALPAHLALEGGALRLSFEAAGAAYPVTVDPLIATQQAKLVASDGATNDRFGHSVSVSGDTAVVGADGKSSSTGAAYVFARSGSTWTPQAKLVASDGSLNDTFGSSISVSGDTTVVGASGKSSSTGAAYVFVRSGSAWSQQAKLLASDGAAVDYFAYSVSVSGDTAVAGAPYAGSYYGAAYVFVRSGTAWTQQAKLLADDGAAVDYFGFSVSVWGDTAIVGAYQKSSGTGAVYVFVRSAGAWTQQAKLLASDGAVVDSFGWSVSLSVDTAVVGAYNKGSGTGAAYVFVRSGSTWAEQAGLVASDGATNDCFGFSVSVSGDTAVVGANARSSGAGAAYLFARNGGSWSQQGTLPASDGASADYFGTAVAVAGDTAVVGAYQKNSATGAAYVFSVRKANGDPCTNGVECTSGFCVDGTCCVDACTATCKSCANAAGTCTSNVPQGAADPDALPACAGVHACDGAGSCKKVDGEACVTGGECVSTSCAAGVCCNEECDAPCHYCQPAGQVGTCKPVPNGEDPRRECQASTGGNVTCAGTCQAGQCAFPDVGTGCGTCAACDGTGRCTQTPADDSACGTIACGGLSTACRAYQDLTANRCAALGTCKSANAPASCTSWSDLPCTDGSVPVGDGGQPDGNGGTGGGGGGCGCATAPIPGGGVAALALLLIAVFRRRPGRP